MSPLITKSRSRVGAAIVACAAALLLTASPTRASTITYSELNWMAFPGNIALPQFDASLGTLTSVLITMSGLQYADMRYENPTQNTFDVTTSWSSWLTVYDPFAALLSASQTQGSTDTVTAFDGVKDYGGASGNSFYWSDNPSITNLYTDAAKLAFVTGTGSLLFAANAYSEASISFPGGNLWQLYDVVTEASVWVTYEYDPAAPPVPEPATLTLIGTAFLAAGLRRRFAHRR